MKDYIVYDGRANVDPDDACILEIFKAKDNEAAKAYFNKEYAGTDSVLCDKSNNVVY